VIPSIRNSIGIVTALNPCIGHATEAHTTFKGVAQIVLVRGLMSKEMLDEDLRPEVLTLRQARLSIHSTTLS
jgi:aspartate ammonia-lyase